MKNITLSTDSDGLMLATLDMPGRPFNVFSEDMMADLAELIDMLNDAFAKGNAPRGVVISSGKSSFVAGADLAMIQDFGAMRFRASWQEMRDRYSYLGKLFRRLEKLPVPVVAAVNGLALGGGLELAMACHGRVCADGPQVQLGLPEILLGLLPGAGGTQRLPRYVGLELGCKMLLDGKPLSPAAALEAGLVDRLAAADELIAQAKALALTLSPSARWDRADYCPASGEVDPSAESFVRWARELAGISEREAQLYPAVAAIINCVKGGLGKDIDAACDVEWDIFVDLMSHPTSSNMVTTCFLTKTAATKNSLAGLPKVTAPASIGIAPGVNLGERAFKRLQQAPVGEADFVIAGADDQNAPIGVSVDLRVSSDPDDEFVSGAPLLRLLREFSKSEVLELVSSGDARADARAIAVLQSSAKPVVLTRSADSVNQVLIAGLREAFTESGESRETFFARCEAVGLAPLFEFALGEAPELVESNRLDKTEGLPLLLALSTRVAVWLSGELPKEGDAKAKDALLAGVDLLAVYGVGFPKWTGGPLSCLTMFQRGELELKGSTTALSRIPFRFKNEWGYSLQAA